jgi:uncharacterized membrane protein YdbT with pleckstrin-like domain
MDYQTEMYLGMNAKEFAAAREAALAEVRGKFSSEKEEDLAEEQAEIDAQIQASNQSSLEEENQMKKKRILTLSLIGGIAVIGIIAAIAINKKRG